ncbi:MAG TPA: hypothetical protein PL110_01875 [Candidatus Eremiobacteraeota bacterium]|nr:MAG: hypothetical protein BWY64_00559 [bacterium ADurb.Bin363]HPZ06838.1 hypothetical protein [Candidatus Eremiobacteraeota bacterium]
MDNLIKKSMLQIYRPVEHIRFPAEEYGISPEMAQYLSPIDYLMLDGSLLYELQTDPFLTDSKRLSDMAMVDEAKIRQDEEKEELERDKQEFRELFQKIDTMWTDDFGGNRDLVDAIKPEGKISELKDKKNDALRVHDSNLSDLESEKSSLESELASVTDEDEKARIQEKIKDVEAKIEAEKARKEETQKQEEEKISQKKEDFQILKDRLYDLREEVRRYNNDMENANNYYETGMWEEDIKLRLSEIKLEIESIERKMSDAMIW